jgi:D-glycero-alpha-D-manno-heptose-7-phosphate kinase
VRIDSSAPTRIDLAGGTFDIWPLYLFHDHAQTINAAISLRAHCTLTARDDDHVTLISEDTGEHVEADSPETLPVNRLPLVARLVRHFGVRGIDVRTRAEPPVGAGIAGSSAMNVALAGALAAWQGRSLTDDQLLTIAMNIEAQVIRVPTGVQDYDRRLRRRVRGGAGRVQRGRGHRRPRARRRWCWPLRAPRKSGINNWDVMMRHQRRPGRGVAFDPFGRARDPRPSSGAMGAPQALARSGTSQRLAPG